MSDLNKIIRMNSVFPVNYYAAVVFVVKLVDKKFQFN